MPDTLTDLDRQHLATLDRLVGYGMVLCDDLVVDWDVDPGRKAEPFDRLSRAVRRTIALAQHIARPERARRAESVEQPAESPEPSAVARPTPDLASAPVPQPGETAERADRAESARADWHEPLDDPAFAQAIATKRVPDLIAELQSEFGHGASPDRPGRPPEPAAPSPIGPFAAPLPPNAWSGRDRLTAPRTPIGQAAPSG